jgi:hypothetical protein
LSSIGAKKTLETETSYEITSSKYADLFQKIYASKDQNKKSLDEISTDNLENAASKVENHVSEFRPSAPLESEIRERVQAKKILVQELPKEKIVAKKADNNIIVPIISQINGSSFYEFCIFISMAFMTTILVNTYFAAIIAHVNLLKQFAKSFFIY